jgi:NAD(P)-dependent dehydrogenase (short-subunit alcohol dehydrogenase family)
MLPHAPHVVPCTLQVAIITGSGQGLGASAAKLFAQHGARVVVTDLDGAKADQVWHGKQYCFMQ